MEYKFKVTADRPTTELILDREIIIDPKEISAAQELKSQYIFTTMSVKDICEISGILQSEEESKSKHEMELLQLEGAIEVQEKRLDQVILPSFKKFIVTQIPCSCLNRNFILIGDIQL